MKNKRLYAMEIYISDCVRALPLTPLSRKQYKEHLANVASDMGEVDREEHFVMEKEKTIIDNDYYTVVCKIITLDTSDIYFYVAECKDNRTFKPGIKMTNLFKEE